MCYHEKQISKSTTFIKIFLFNIIWAILTFTLFLIIGCGEGYQYKKAKKTNTIEQYESFLDQYPKSHYAAELNDSLRILYYKMATDSNNIGTYKLFLNRFTDGDYVSVIKSRLLGLRYHDTKEVATKESYKRFLEDYPDSPFSKEIELLYNDYDVIVIKDQSNVYFAVPVTGIFYFEGDTLTINNTTIAISQGNIESDPFYKNLLVGLVQDHKEGEFGLQSFSFGSGSGKKVYIDEPSMIFVKRIVDKVKK